VPSDKGGAVEVRNCYINTLGVYFGEFSSAALAVSEGRYPIEHFEENEVTGVPVASGTPPPEMAARAVRHALRRHGGPAPELDLLCYVSIWFQGPEGWCPPSYVQRETVGGAFPAIELRHGCNGMFSALELAVSRIRGAPRPAGTLLVCADNLTSPLIDRWLAASPGMVLGDAALALVVGPEPGFARIRSIASVTLPDLEELHRSGTPLFSMTDATPARLDFKARATHFARQAPDVSRQMHDRITRAQTAVVRQALDEAGIGLADVARVAYMNVSRRMIERQLLEPLGLQLHHTAWELGRDVGHVGPADQLVALDRLLSTGQLAPGQHLLMVGQGPGVNIAACVLEIVAVPSWLQGKDSM
jgi:3-oxoacyl-[acyl-carrier-protein] synthase III